MTPNPGPLPSKKEWQQKVSMHFLAAQGLLNNILKVYPLVHKGKCNRDVKEISLKAEMNAI